MAWTVVPDASIETGDWISTGVVTDLCDNEQYVYDSCTRTGGPATGYGIRLALARGRTYFQESNEAHALYTGSDDIVYTANVTFATDSLDGNPNFKYDANVLPNVFITVEDYLEAPATDTYWYDDDIWIKQSIQSAENRWRMSPSQLSFTKTTGLSNKGFSVQLWFNTTARRKFMGYLNWVAVGEVATGE